MRSIFSLAFIVLAIATFFIFTNPLYKEVGSLRAEAVTYKNALNNLSNLETQRDTLLASYRSIKQEDVDKLEHLLPNTVNSIELILEIEKIANSSGVYVRDIKFGTGEESSDANNGNEMIEGMNPVSSLPYGEFTIDFSVDGSYESFVGFIKELESNLRIVDIEAVSFEAVSKEKGSGLSFELKIKTYWLK